MNGSAGAAAPHGLIVVVPVYRAAPSADEQRSLTRLIACLPTVERVLIHPQGLPLAAYARWPARTLALPAGHFRSASAYSRLLLSEGFYRRFDGYEFMLLHQTDVFLCHGDLARFLGDDYDYIGAPWMTPRRCPWPCLRGARFVSPPGWSRALVVGNGGLSLRRVARFIGVLRRHRVYAAAARVTGTHEDIFFSSLRGRDPGHLRIPDRDMALGFAFDREPRRCLAATNGRLPFGMHNPWGYDRAFFDDEVLQRCPDVSLRSGAQASGAS
jgi:hypothetical protein